LAEETEGERQYLIARYNADRAHELELDKITGLYELAFFQAAAILNGVSATVFVSFFGSTLDKVRVAGGFLSASFFLWLLGLFLALWGGHVAYEAQKRFVSARRNRRHATGARAARGQTQGLAVSNWHFDVPHSLPNDQRHKYMRDTQAILAGLLNRDFATVEIVPYSMIEFARAVEARWPCPEATAMRERLEVQQPRDDQEDNRREYSRRERTRSHR
jgi:hypothetical protein